MSQLDPRFQYATLLLLLSLKPRRRPTHFRTWRRCALVVVFAGLRVLAAEPDPVAGLPPPAPGPVDFAHDIQPLLAASCLRCHGPERAKGGLRLDSRERALAGGDRGVALVPGDSAHSPLIRYVARLAPDLEMPPPEQGEPLTRAQVALLRAWIDEGLAWAQGPTSNRLEVTVEPFAGGTMVKWGKVPGAFLAARRRCRRLGSA